MGAFFYCYPEELNCLTGGEACFLHFQTHVCAPLTHTVAFYCLANPLSEKHVGIKVDVDELVSMAVSISQKN